MYTQMIRSRMQESIDAVTTLLHDETTIAQIASLADAIAASILQGGKLLICGNGGSAADALHIAGEILGRFQKERRGYAAVALNADVATLTAIANDYGYEQVFSRQVEGLMTKQDILLGISTSGNSANIIHAFAKAKEIGGKTALLSGKDGGSLKSQADFAIIAPSQITAHVQECHLCIYHILCELIENALISNNA